MDDKSKDSFNIKENKTTRVATYARVSTQEQVSEGTSLEFQNSQLTAYCQLQGWAIVNSYTDPGYSGKDGRRPGLERLLVDAKTRLFERVVVYKLDQMARNIRLMLDIEAKLGESRVSLTSIKESVDTSSSTGKLIFSVISTIAEWEREAIIERTKNGRLQRYREGCWAGGKAPYRYSYDIATRKLVVKESEARVVRRMYSEYAAGKTLFGISQSLNRDGIPARTKNGRGWWQTAVRQVLLSMSPYVRREWLDGEVWKRIEEIMDDPNKLLLLINESVENLRLTEAELSARIRPIDEKLNEIAEQKARLAEDWIMRHMDRERFKELRDTLDREEARIRAVRAEIDPTQIEELENTRSMLDFWEGQMRAMAWNTENEDGTMTRLVDGPHRAALMLIGFEDTDLSRSAGFPTSRRQLLDKLQVKLSVLDDRVEVKSLFPVEPVGVQLCTSTKGDGEGFRNDEIPLAPSG